MALRCRVGSVGVHLTNYGHRALAVLTVRHTKPGVLMWQTVGRDLTTLQQPADDIRQQEFRLGVVAVLQRKFLQFLMQEGKE